jgi:hypothetical protein
MVRDTAWTRIPVRHDGRHNVYFDQRRKLEIVLIWGWQTHYYEQAGYTVDWELGWPSLFGLTRRAWRHVVEERQR